MNFFRWITYRSEKVNPVLLWDEIEQIVVIDVMYITFILVANGKIISNVLQSIRRYCKKNFLSLIKWSKKPYSLSDFRCCKGGCTHILFLFSCFLLIFKISSSWRIRDISPDSSIEKKDIFQLQILQAIQYFCKVNLIINYEPNTFVFDNRQFKAESWTDSDCICEHDLTFAGPDRTVIAIIMTNSNKINSFPICILVWAWRN